jgi:hypothetical protein
VLSWRLVLPPRLRVVLAIVLNVQLLYENYVTKSIYDMLVFNDTLKG